MFFFSEDACFWGITNLQRGRAEPRDLRHIGGCSVIVVSCKGIGRLVRQGRRGGENADLEINCGRGAAVSLKDHILPFAVRRGMLNRKLIATSINVAAQQKVANDNRSRKQKCPHLNKHLLLQPKARRISLASDNLNMCFPVLVIEG